MGEKMSLQQVRDAMLEEKAWARSTGWPMAAGTLQRWADAIDAHLTQPAQVVDVGAVAKCPDCNGHGQARVVVATTPGSFLSPPEDHYDIDVCPSCDGSGESSAATHEAMVAAYDAVHRSCLTREVKTPETKARIVRDAITAALPNANGKEG